MLTRLMLCARAHYIIISLYHHIIISSYHYIIVCSVIVTLTTALQLRWRMTQRATEGSARQRRRLRLPVKRRRRSTNSALRCCANGSLTTRYLYSGLALQCFLNAFTTRLDQSSSTGTVRTLSRFTSICATNRSNRTSRHLTSTVASRFLRICFCCAKGLQRGPQRTPTPSPQLCALQPSCEAA
jgi:hypothetical protein